MPSFFSRSLAPMLVLGAISVVCVSTMVESVFRADISDGEKVCISVTVIGLDGGDPGTGCTVVAEAPSSSSSSSSSFSTSTSSTSSAGASSASAASQRSAPSGAYRYTRERSHWKIVQLLRQWARRNTLHAAPDEHAWYDEAVRALQQKGYIDVADNLRLDAQATRAETAKLIILFSGLQTPLPSIPSFDDAIVGAWYGPFIERAAQQTWMIGYNNCYGTRPCIFRPAATITRAEAAATFVRVFELYPSYSAPKFTDVAYHAWYRDAMQAAADACIVQGERGVVRPEDPVTRAELFVMFYRAMHRLQYGMDCSSATEPVINSVPSEPLFDEEPLCSASVPMCLFEALRADAGDVIQPLFASLLSIRLRDVTNIPLTEWLLWTLLCIVPIGAISSVYHLKNRGHKDSK